MRDRHWSPSGAPKGRFMLIVVPLVITMAVGVVIGIRLVSERDASLQLSARGAPSAGSTPAVTTSGPASQGAAARASPTGRDVPAAAAASMSCVLILPASPLTAQGLATPFQLTGPGGMSPQASGCTMANSASLGAFAQATIFDPATGALSTYQPLVITQGTQPAAAPVVPRLPAGAVVTIDFGFNGTNLTLKGATGSTLGQARCVNGIRGSIFGQVSFCNGVAFFAAVSKSIASGTTAIPASGTSARTGQPCPTTRSFTMIDQDQSDNVTTQYLLTRNGQTAQDNAANKTALPGAAVVSNGSDNALLTGFLDPILGCTPFTAPDLSNAGTPGTSQALDELFAARNQTAPIALVPENDPMTLVNGAFSERKTNQYRASVGQPAIGAAQADTPAAYCQNMVDVASLFLKNNQALLTTGASPVPAVGNSLFTFLASRLSTSFTNLNCGSFGVTNPVAVTVGGNGVATAAAVNTTQQAAASMTGQAGAANPAAAARPKRGQNPAGM